MTRVLGRTRTDGASAALGDYRAADGSVGAPVAVDVDGPHAALVVGKRGYGKSHTLGVFAEELARAAGVTPVVLDPMGVFGGLASAPVGATVVERPAVRATALPPRAWCGLFGLSPEDSVGALVWRAAETADSLAGMCDAVADATAERTTRRAAENHLRLAAEWDVFDADGQTADDLTDGATVLDLAGLDRAPANAVARAVAAALYDARVAGRTDRLPWLLVDEAHAFFDGVAAPALRTLLTRGRHPGVSLVVATQRPAALPAVAVSQADLVVAHRLTARDDLDALAASRPTYVSGTLAERMPTTVGDATVVDDATEDVHAVSVRERETPPGGASPRASDGSGR